ncbi:MAG: flippase-like domain-containing protein [Bdellovibrionales bacterium]|nr:flippase-like domain-containing protein [Bdellovibrionales bacterium]
MLASSRVRLLMKLTVVGVLLVVLARRGFLSFEATAGAFREPGLLGRGVVLCLIATAIAIARWRFLLQAQKIELSTREVVELALVGNFFNLALPGAVSGDLVKAVYIGRSARSRRAHALSSILFDRVAGLTGLVLLAGGALAYGYDLPGASALVEALELLLLSSGIGALVVFSYLMWVKPAADPVLKILRRLERRGRWMGSILRVYEGVSAYGSQRMVLALSIGASILVHGSNVLAFAYFNEALGVSGIDPISLLVVVPAAMLVTAIPILPGGIGTGHYSFAAFYSVLGSSNGADAFNLFLMSQFLLGAFGGLVYLRGSYSKTG